MSSAGSVVCGDEAPPEVEEQEDCRPPFYKSPRLWAGVAGCIVAFGVWGALSYSGATAYALTAIGFPAITPAVFVVSAVAGLVVGEALAFIGLTAYNFWWVPRHSGNNVQQAGDGPLACTTTSDSIISAQSGNTEGTIITPDTTQHTRF